MLGSVDPVSQAAGKNEADNFNQAERESNNLERKYFKKKQEMQQRR